MKDSIELSILLNARAEILYKAWLNSREHGNFTGSPAKVDPNLKGKFTAWEGYIFGSNVKLEPYTKIVQAWRTTEFDEKEEDSTLEIIFEEKDDKTKLTLKHYNIPEGQGEDYKKGWKDFYFKPMKKYYNKK
jgi:activator of HSP90 ATPase